MPHSVAQMTDLHIHSKNFTMLRASPTKQTLCSAQTLAVHMVTALGLTVGAGLLTFYGNFCINTHIRHAAVMAGTLAQLCYLGEASAIR